MRAVLPALGGEPVGVEDVRLTEQPQVVVVEVQREVDRPPLWHLEAAASASRRASELARLRFESGAADFLQVLDADRSRLAAEEQLARGRAEAGALLVTLYRAFGAEWPAQ